MNKTEIKDEQMTIKDWKKMLANSAWVECAIVFIIFVEFLKNLFLNN